LRLASCVLRLASCVLMRTKKPALWLARFGYLVSRPEIGLHIQDLL